MFVRKEQCTKNVSDDVHVCVYYFSQTHMGRTQWWFSRRAAADKRTTAGVQDRVRVLAGRLSVCVCAKRARGCLLSHCSCRPDDDISHACES